MDLKDFDNLREGNRLEAKDARGGLPRSMWETYSAFANTAGGFILLGVEEGADGSLHAVGLTNPEKMVDDLWNALNNTQKASANVLSENDVSILQTGEKRIVVVNVPRANRHVKPVFVNNNPLSGTYRRNRSGDYHCSYEEIQSMMRDASTESQDAKVVDSQSIEELDHDTIRRYRNNYKGKHEGHPWNDLAEDEFLRCIGAAAKAADGELHPTGAGLLMFGKEWNIVREFPHYFLDYRQQTDDSVRWDDRVTSQTGDWSGNLYDFYQRAYNKLKQALKVPFKMEGIYRVDDTPAHRALREALANCLTNANYYERRGIVCLWTANALELANPGDFRIDISSAIKGGRSDPRNETLMKLFALVDIGERAGSGLPKIFGGWRESGFPDPVIEEEFSPDRTTITLPFVVTKPLVSSGSKKPEVKTGSKKPEVKTGSKTEEHKRQIVLLLKSRGVSSKSEIAEHIGLKSSRTSEILNLLIADGVVQPEGAYRNKTYRLK